MNIAASIPQALPQTRAHLVGKETSGVDFLVPGITRHQQRPMIVMAAESRPPSSIP